MQTTTTHTEPCGCTRSETRGENGELLFIDEGMCRKHLAHIWENIDTTTPHTRYFNVYTVDLDEQAQARMKELTEEQQ